MEQKRRNGQSRPQRKSSQKVQGAHFAEHSERKPAQPPPRQRSTGGAHAKDPAPQQRTRRPTEQHSAPQNRAQRPAQRRPMQHRQPANTQRRPQQNRPQQGRQQQYRPRPENQRPPQRQAGYGTRAAAARRPQQYRGARRGASDSGSSIMFILFLVLYVIIAGIIIRAVVKKANGYMQEYEASRPRYKIEEYVSNMGSGFYNDMLEQAIEKMELSPYEPASAVLKRTKADDGTTGSGGYTYKKTENFSDSKPSYYIMRNDKVIAALTAERSGWTAKYSFPEWRIADPVSLIEVDSEPVYSLSVTMPRGSRLRVNGKSVEEDELRETDSELILTNVERQYMKQPLSVKFELTGLYTPPEIAVTDENGKTLEPERTPEPGEAEQVYLFTKHDTAEPDEQLIQRAEELTKAYFDYIINKDADRYNNIAKLNNYLLPGSDASVLMQSMLNDVYWNNPYTSRTDKIFKVTHVKMYSEKLCTVEIQFDTTLTKQVTNEYSGSVRWVMVNNGFTWYATSMKLLP